MNKKIIFAILLCIAISVVNYSCNKSDSGSAVSKSFTINGIADVSVEKDNSVVLPLIVAQGTGTQKTVALSVSGVPANVSASFSSPSGTPTYTSNLTLTASGASTAGTYPIKVTGTSDAGSNDYTFNLTVKVPSDCISGFFGNRTISSSCFGSSTIITKNTTGTNRITLSEINNGTSIYADLNCDTKTITIPSQPRQDPISPDETISGTGTFTTNPNVLTITYTITYPSGFPGGPSTCTATIQ